MATTANGTGPRPRLSLRRMNLANQLTMLRVALVPVFIGCLMFENHWGYLLGLLVFIGAAITDHYDGKIARERNLITDFGRFMDPLADKLLLCAAFIYFTGTTPSVPAWVVIAIVGREFAVSGLRLMAAMRGRVIAADMSGKVKTVIQITFVITILILMTGQKLLVAFTNVWQDHYTLWLQWISHGLIAITLIATIYSGYRYLSKHRDLLIDGFASPAN